MEGRVLTPRRLADSTVPAPVRGQMVTLHRVGRDTAGALDSVRTDANGRYRFSFRPFGADAIYFASVTYGGIAYFTPPLRDSLVRGDVAEITVFDTTTRAFPLSVRGRHLIVGAIDSTNTRTVIEVFEIENDSLLTLISADGEGAAATFRTAMPAAARDVRINDAEISANAFVHAPGVASFFTPIAPGLKQLTFSYRMPAADFPVAYTLDHAVDVLEVLLEDSRGTVANEKVAAVAPVTLEGRTFRRFLGQDLAAGDRVIVELPTTRPLSFNLYIAALLILIGAVMLLVLSRAMSRRTVGGPVLVAPAEPALPLHEQLAREIAALDAVYARTPEPSEAVRDAYERRRAELRDALAAALAEPAGRR